MPKKPTGFKNVQKSIAKNSGVPMKNAATATRKVNPALKRVLPKKK